MLILPPDLQYGSSSTSTSSTKTHSFGFYTRRVQRKTFVASCKQAGRVTRNNMRPKTIHTGLTISHPRERGEREREREREREV